MKKSEPVPRLGARIFMGKKGEANIIELYFVDPKLRIVEQKNISTYSQKGGL